MLGERRGFGSLLACSRLRPESRAKAKARVRAGVRATARLQPLDARVLLGVEEAAVVLEHLELLLVRIRVAAAPVLVEVHHHHLQLVAA